MTHVDFRPDPTIIPDSNHDWNCSYSQVRGRVVFNHLFPGLRSASLQTLQDAAKKVCERGMDLSGLSRAARNIHCSHQKDGDRVSAIASFHVLRLPLWPDKTIPSSRSSERIRELTPGRVDRFISNVWVPEIYVHPAPAEKANGAAAILCPGGAYGGVAIDREGHDVARWLNTIGVTGIVLKYRMPRADLSVRQTPWPIQDLRYALRLVRSKAPEWKLDPTRIGAMGFSAGGHMASTVGTRFDSGKPDAADAMDRLNCRPDFLVLGYPVISFKARTAHSQSRTNLIGKNAGEKLIEEYSSELHVTPQTPPTFLVHARNDRNVNVANSIQFADAQRKAGVPCYPLLCEKGGHGFGLGTSGGEVAQWPALCEKWLRLMRIIP